MTLKVGSRDVIGLKRGALDIPALYRANFKASISLNTFNNATGGYEFYYQLAGSYYKAHAFFVGSHTINFIGDGYVDYLVVAGGGSGSTGTSINRNAGGGAGGFRTGTLSVTSGSKIVIVGDGGVPNSNGQDSTFDSITSAGGGRGGTQNANGINGGSGGGGGGGTTAARAGGLGNVPATDPPQGNNGSRNFGFPYTGGCGGGAGSVGLQTEGGSGLPSNITGIERYYAGGGGAAGHPSAPARPGGVGGGGNGGQPASPYTGGGGGGGQRGGSGIVVIRYQITEEEYNANYQQPPYIINQSESLVIAENVSYTLFVDAVDYSSGLDLSIQWQVSTNNGQSWSNISGATSPNYTATAQFSDNGNLYRAFLSGSNNSIYSENVSLSVFITYLENVLVSNVVVPTSATSATFAVTYDSNTEPSIQWQTSLDGITWTNINGANSTTYTKQIQLSDNNTFYRASLTNSSMPFDYLKRSVVNSQTATLTLSDSNWAYADIGGTITTFSQNGSNWRCHTFDTPGSHPINFTSPGLVEYLIIGGGGGGGLVYFRSSGYHFIGGGGAGGYRSGHVSVATGESAIIAGSGGAIKTDGGLSSFNGIESAGGGGGGSHHSAESYTGRAGGSGGGSGRGGGNGGAGNTPAVVPSQGNRGGAASTSGGGGGGAGGEGQSYVSRYGGLGLASDITGNIVVRATGGSAGDRSLNTAEPGNGGRGNGQTGFDGQVVIRYKI